MTEPKGTWEAEELAPDPHGELDRLSARLAQLERSQALH